MALDGEVTNAIMLPSVYYRVLLALGYGSFCSSGKRHVGSCEQAAARTSFLEAFRNSRRSEEVKWSLPTRFKAVSATGVIEAGKDLDVATESFLFARRSPGT